MDSLICGRIDNLGLVAREQEGSGEDNVRVLATVRTVPKSRRQPANQGRASGHQKLKAIGRG